MSNEQAIDILTEVKYFDDSMYQYNPKYMEALDMAIEALKNDKSKFIAYADERIETMKHFVHVTINDPKYGEVDGWLDKARQVLFTDAVTTDFAKKVYGWTWKEKE